MTTTASRTTAQLEASEVAVLDEAAIAAAAADFSRDLSSLTSRMEVYRRDAQARFDAQGLPRGAYRSA